MNSIRRVVERLVTKSDYFHRYHYAEKDFLDPLRSYYYDLRARADYPGEFKDSLPVIEMGDVKYVNPVCAAQYGGCPKGRRISVT